MDVKGVPVLDKKNAKKGMKGAMDVKNVPVLDKDTKKGMKGAMDVKGVPMLGALTKVYFLFQNLFLTS